MKFVSLLGLLVVVGLAWAVSYDRCGVRLRPLVWGLALQFILAVIVLRADFWSFAGMAALALLIVVYLWSEAAQSWAQRGLVAAATLAAGAVCLLLPTKATGAVFLALIPLLLFNGRFKLWPAAQRYAGAWLVVAGVAWLVGRRIYGTQLFQTVGVKITNFLGLSDYGARFLFGNLADPAYFFPNPNTGWPGLGFLFAFKVLPLIVFFGALMALAYYLGVMQRVIEAASRFVRWTTGTSGAETLVCTANIFIGQTEAPLLIRPFIAGLTRSELITVMIAGFATMAGGSIAIYSALGIPAEHLLAASVMSAPAALTIAKIILPESEKAQTAGDTPVPQVSVGANVFEALTNGISDGMRLAANVGAMLIGFIALIAAADLLFNYLDYWIDGRLLGGAFVKYSATGLTPVAGEFSGVFPGSLQTLFGTLLRPVAWLLGVPWGEAGLVGNLIGTQISLNEFIAYTQLSAYVRDGAISSRSLVIATYALCGFSNFSSIGIQIGGLSALAPERRADLAKFGLRAMFGGALASWLTAAIAGILL